MIDELAGSPIFLGGLIVAALVVGFLLDELRWRLKSDEALVEMTQSSDPKRVLVGLTRLRKRGKDISEGIHRVLPFLMAEKAVDRVAAKMAVQKLYPEDYQLMRKYSGTDELDLCRQKLESLHAKYGVESRT